MIAELTLENVSQQCPSLGSSAPDTRLAMMCRSAFTGALPQRWALCCVELSVVMLCIDVQFVKCLRCPKSEFLS